MAQPVYPTHPTSMPMPEFVMRTRREFHPTDSINARQFEHWQTGGKHMTYDRPDPNRAAPYMDMLPNSSRTTDRSFRSQPRYDAEGPKGVQNTYFDKYDTTSDARNMVRELRTTVYEDKNTGFMAESQRLLERTMDQRWVNPEVVRQQAHAAMELRPKMDDFRLWYHNQAVPQASLGASKGCAT